MTNKQGYIYGTGRSEETPVTGSYQNIATFRLLKPDPALFLNNPQLTEVWNNDPSSTFFVLYALIQDLSEAVEQAVTLKRSKGGFVENHWGTRPSTISASGKIGLYLSEHGITQYPVEDPGEGRGDTVLDWDPTASVILTDVASELDSTSDYFNQKAQGLLNMGMNKLGSSLGGVAGKALSAMNINNTSTPNNSFKPPAVTSDHAAKTGTNLAFRKFRMLLDLFKHNGLILSTVPNMSIYPSTYTAQDVYTTPDGKQGVAKSLIEQGKTVADAAAFMAPGNVMANTPIEMTIKDTIYRGFFQNFNFTLSEEDPYTASYQFTFIARTTERTSYFFNSGTAGKRSHPSINQSSSGGSQ